MPAALIKELDNLPVLVIPAAMGIFRLWTSGCFMGPNSELIAAALTPVCYEAAGGLCRQAAAQSLDSLLPALLFCKIMALKLTHLAGTIPF